MATAVQAVQVVSEGWLDVPWVIWSGLISAVVASGVAAFTTRSSSKNSLRLLAKQHARDDEEASRQRGSGSMMPSRRTRIEKGLSVGRSTRWR